MLIISGQSGSGKSTLETILSTKFGMNKLVSYTTRQPRKGEVDGINYHYITKEKFDELLSQGFFAEYTKHGDTNYALAVKDCVDNSVAVVNVDGIIQLNNVPGITVFSVFLELDLDNRELHMLKRGDSWNNILDRRDADYDAFYNNKPSIDSLTNLVINIKEYIDKQESLAQLIYDIYRANTD